MADRVKKVSYAYITLPHRAGHGARVLDELREAGVNLLAFHAFPSGSGKAQADFVAEDNAALRRVAKNNDWKLSKMKKAFLVQGDDRVGAAQRHFDRLAEGGINVIASSAITAGRGRYGMIVWVKPKDYTKAARLLRAR